MRVFFLREGKGKGAFPYIGGVPHSCHYLVCVSYDGGWGWWGPVCSCKDE